MKRTKLSERSLPNYTCAEEMMNMITHIVGGAAGMAVLVMSVIMSLIEGNAVKLLAGMIYGMSFVQIYAISSVYHGLRPSYGKKVMQVIDHTSIYLYIAGTYTPITVVLLIPEYPIIGWTILILEWGLAACAIVFTAIDLERYRIFSMALYIIMGWLILPAFGALAKVMSITGIILLALGGVVYTIGAVIYGLSGKKRFMHAVFHVFVLAGSILQALSILLYVM